MLDCKLIPGIFFCDMQMPPKKASRPTSAASRIRRIASTAFRNGDNSGMLALKAKSSQGKTVTVTQTTLIKISK